jgi:hypothetical protein
MEKHSDKAFTEVKFMASSPGHERLNIPTECLVPFPRNCVQVVLASLLQECGLEKNGISELAPRGQHQMPTL